MKKIDILLFASDQPGTYNNEDNIGFPGHPTVKSEIETVVLKSD